MTTSMLGYMFVIAQGARRKKANHDTDEKNKSLKEKDGEKELKEEPKYER